MFKFKKSLERVNRVSNDEDRSFFKLRLDRNEKIFSFNQKYKKKFSKYVEKLDLNLYPNFNKTYIKLSKYIKFDRKNILITEGVSGAIKSILDSTLIEKKLKLLYLSQVLPYTIFIQKFMI